MIIYTFKLVIALPTEYPPAEVTEAVTNALRDEHQFVEDTGGWADLGTSMKLRLEDAEYDQHPSPPDDGHPQYNELVDEWFEKAKQLVDEKFK